MLISNTMFLNCADKATLYFDHEFFCFKIYNKDKKILIPSIKTTNLTLIFKLQPKNILCFLDNIECT